LCAYLPWKILIAALLVAAPGQHLHLFRKPSRLELYQRHLRILLLPLRVIPLQVGKVDFSRCWPGDFVPRRRVDQIALGHRGLYTRLPL